MGPRSGSPATETLRARAVLHRRAVARRRGTALFIWLLAGAAPAWAASVETSHNVAVVVVTPEISIQEERSDLSLPLGQPQTVHYHVRGNSLPSAPAGGVISAAVESAAPGIELKADVGTFANNGTEGNILLHASSSGEQILGEVPVPLADKQATAGTQASVLNGTVAVSWEASPTQEYSSSESNESIVTLTVKDL